MWTLKSDRMFCAKDIKVQENQGSAYLQEAELVVRREGKTGHHDKRVVPRSGGVLEPGMCRHSSHENRETSIPTATR